MDTKPSTHGVIAGDALAEALSLRDLTDPAAGRHAMQLLVAQMSGALEARWNCDVLEERGSRVVSVADNYDCLGYASEAVTRDARYSRYLSRHTLLRTHTSALIPPLLRRIAALTRPPADLLLVCPGIVYRRDSIDRLHTGQPHQLDLWRVRRGVPLSSEDLRDMIETVVRAIMPGAAVTCTPAQHPYTVNGLQVDVLVGGVPIEIGECGLAHPAVLGRAGLDPEVWTGLAMGLGLDRLLMLVKGIGDIRLLRSEDPRVAVQMQDLEPWRPVSHRPAIRRDLSVAVEADITAEEIGDRVREAMNDALSALESIEVVSETGYDGVPAAARSRIGMQPGQKNLLLRLVLRDLHRTLTSAEANQLRDRVYAAVHEGTVNQWAVR